MMNVGDRIMVNENAELFYLCEGHIIEVMEDGSYLVDLYRGNGRITQEEVNEYNVYFLEKELDLI